MFQLLQSIQMLGSNSSGLLPRQQSVAAACSLSKFLVGESTYLDSSSSGYLNASKENWSQTCWLEARCIVRPTTATYVAVLLKVISFMNTPFAIRGRGHNPNSGFGSIDSTGILIDLSLLVQTDVSADQKSIKVGAGNEWMDVYKALDSLGLSAVGTKEPVPGIVGSILGGGSPFFPSMYGFICDNVKGFQDQVVLSNSKVVYANANTNADLFKALKGGGPNYGIITQVELYTVPLHDVWYGFNVYNSSQNAALLQALVKYQELSASDPKAGVVFTLVGSTTVVGFLYAAHAAKPSVFGSFYDIPVATSLVTPTNGTVQQLSTLVGELSVPGTANRHIFGISIKVDAGLYQDISLNYAKIATNVSSTASLILSYQPLTAAAVTASKNGQNSLGVQPQAQNWLAGVMSWQSDTDTASSQDNANKLYSQIQSLARSQNLLLPFEFQNDAAFTQKPLQGIGQPLLQSLQTVSKKYDPSQTFQNLQNSGFLLSKK
ncbi:fad linked oxidase protein [Rutstroemia sp. NJR-2017a BVV2]|nr:fad linked oxidase protein [Rutstroemia sp. NJR-2017a BVV2]